MTILGIETSHDDTSIALWKNNKIIEFIIFSQIDIFKEFGGTVPEIASREHTKNIQIILNKLLKTINFKQIDLIAYTSEPGLIGSLQVGKLFAYALSSALQVELMPINHMLGHLYSVNIEKKAIKYPALALVVSGGHSEIIKCDFPGDYQIIGQTQDDAIGEVFDKISSKLNLGFPGGPIINKIYNESTFDSYINFTKPRTLNEFDFSFSGLKTQVINYHNKHQFEENYNINLVVSSFMDTSINYLLSKFKLAIKKFEPNSIILCGGVSSNSILRERFLKLHSNAFIPEKKYCQDNAAMIAQCAFELKRRKNV
ncbi:tRNA (adenosine(37)-N6)-threonylcarbamoyltransferase complex transferase subunit TsaD [Mycoplasma phocimorsus]|uniref:tRNA (adenosine(37)-N6)-threonylcarbamoyltransferase complex transferase subunit TsaD n=1 Tax=Mycoplasma phocimorsus TaxID=3045839 RepID=UPI0024BF3D85|nr:tRNA (adenosine(37)-N6)-threonylcarbamoyltransferase complex transferase subunit TsaD [Mycoplasma phocimorsus]MDJ1647801.1 tRNA (adenosine(37)-N6)-threonylcarbamoyltransferase complex transferase subunit TsaD [Mycoplasma phocimorsus]